MWWAIPAAVGIGLLLGLWFRVPALVAASGLTAAACLSLAPFMDLGSMPTLGITFAALGVLQVGYLAGTMLSPCLVEKARLSPADLGRLLSRGKRRGR